MQPRYKWQLQKYLFKIFSDFDIDMDEEATGVSCVHSLTNPALLGKFQATDLSWNSTGSVVAASYPLNLILVVRVRVIM